MAILIQAKMWPMKEKEYRQLLLYSGKLLSPTASCKNASLRFSYKNQPLCFFRTRLLKSTTFLNESRILAFHWT